MISMAHNAEKERREDPTAKDTAPAQARLTQWWTNRMREQSAKFRTNLPRQSQPDFSEGAPPKSSSDLAQSSVEALAPYLPPLTTRDLTREVQCMVLQFPTGQVAEESGASLRAIENVRNGESGMSLKTFVNLCRANPRVRAEAMRLLGCEAETDPDFVQGLSLLLNSFVRQRAETPSVEGAGGEEPTCAAGDLFSGEARAGANMESA